jgi:hypothetical protein
MNTTWWCLAAPSFGSEEGLGRGLHSPRPGFRGRGTFAVPRRGRAGM